jgi:diguanylate cyclase (GGDEF)-like protein/PAS domain S-box-containing protein
VTYDEQFGGRRWRLEFAPRDGRSPAAMPGFAAAGAVLLGGVALLVAAVVLLAMQRVQRAARTRARAELASDSELGLDSEGIVVEADESVGRLTGRARSRWEGQPLWAGVQPDDADSVREAVRLAAGGERRTTVEFRVADEDGRGRWFAARLGNHLDAPLIRRILVQVSDIDARKAAEAEVTRMAFYDPLTDLPNRRLLEERARQVLSSARRNDQRAGVLVIDLDGFKAVNDGAGHAVGDKVLRIVADRMVAAVRESDTVARLGGDEFVVLLAEPSGVPEVNAAAERIAAAIRRPVDLAGNSWRLDASIGAALYPDCNQDFGLLLSAADVAMYRSKRAGGGVLTIAGTIPADA